MIACAGMKAFVTGGSGFLGGRLIRTLVARGDEVLALARSDAAAKRVQAHGATAVRGDLDATDAMASAMRGCQVVFHSAAKVEDWGAPAEFERINVEGTRNVLAAARAASVPRLVHVSTEAQYAGGPMQNLTEDSPRPERPIGEYARTKRAADDLVRAANDDALLTVVVRPRLIWGHGDTSVLPQIIDAVRDGRFRWIAGGHYLTSTCHVDNVVEGMLLAAERGKGGEAYFLTDGEPVEMRTFLSELLRANGTEPPSGSIPRSVARAAAAFTDVIWRTFSLTRQPPVTPMALCLIGQEVTVSDAKARRELGYTAAVSIADGIAECATRSRPPGDG